MNWSGVHTTECGHPRGMNTIIDCIILWSIATSHEHHNIMHNIVVYIKQVTLCHKNSTHVNKEIMAMGKWRKLRCRLLPAALSVILMLPNRFMPTMAHRYMNTSSTNATLDTAGMDLGNW